MKPSLSLVFQTLVIGATAVEPEKDIMKMMKVKSKVHLIKRMGAFPVF